MEDVLPPPVLGALVAAPPQVDLVRFPIRGVLLAVLAGAEPGPAWKSTSESRHSNLDTTSYRRKNLTQTPRDPKLKGIFTQKKGLGGMLKCTYFSLHVL